jgi:hypothetical protein
LDKSKYEVELIEGVRLKSSHLMAGKPATVSFTISNMDFTDAIIVDKFAPESSQQAYSYVSLRAEAELLPDLVPRLPVE